MTREWRVFLLPNREHILQEAQRETLVSLLSDPVYKVIKIEETRPLAHLKPVLVVALASALDEKTLKTLLCLQLAPLHYNVILRDSEGEERVKLVVMDMDSTLIEQEIIDEMAAILGPETQTKIKVR